MSERGCNYRVFERIWRGAVEDIVHNASCTSGQQHYYSSGGCITSSRQAKRNKWKLLQQRKKNMKLKLKRK